jgi:hypothetical protein
MLFLEFGIESSDPQARDEKATKPARLAALLKALEEKCEAVGDDHLLLELIERSLRESPGAWPQERSALTAALKLDGFELVDDSLVVTTPEPAALAPHISLLEYELGQRQLKVASEHYRQAVDNFTRANFEAANGQTRSFLENLFITLCEQRCGTKCTNPNAALQHLRDKGQIDGGEWNNFRAFWNDIQDNGPHQGLSADHEALYRLHVATAIARYLLQKLK